MGELEKLEKKIGIEFKNKDLIMQAFVHRSYLNEHKNFPLNHNERLEFLGDACLELIVTDYLYNKYPNPEGELTNWRAALVRGTMISQVAKELKYDKYLLLSKGEQSSTGKAKDLIMANTFEAVLGAIYLDRGYKISEKFILKFLIPHLDEIISKELYYDPKSRFQELVQEKTGITPIYKLEKEKGPDHDKVFTMGVYIDQNKVAEGNGLSKQNAEQEAARIAIDNWEENINIKKK